MSPPPMQPASASDKAVTEVAAVNLMRDIKGLPDWQTRAGRLEATRAAVFHTKGKT